MAHSPVNGTYPLHHDAPHKHHHRQPAIGRMTADELHIERCEAIEHHGCRHIPECQVVYTPETPVESDIGNQVGHVAAVAPALQIAGNVMQAGNDEPRRIDSPVTVLEEMPKGIFHPHSQRLALFHPREPQPYPTQEQEHIDTHIATASQPEERVVP